MKRILLLIGLLLCFAGIARGQAEIPRYPSDPPTCNPTRGLQYFNTTTQLMMYCSGLNVWSPIGTGVLATAGGSPPQTQVNDPGNPGHLGGTACESFPSLSLGPVNVDCDWHSKGANPYIDITRFGARPCNVSTTPCAGGITASINSGSASATLSSASTFINGDGVVIYGAGTASGLSTPTAPTVNQVLAQMGIETDLTVPGATGATTKCYKIIARTTGGGYTPASPETCTNTGQSTLGIVTVNLSSCSRAATTVTCTTSSATPLLVGLSSPNLPEVYVGGTAGTIDDTFRGWRTVTSAVDSTHFTFVDSAVDTGNGATTSTSGGTATFFTANHLSWTAVTGAWIYYIYGGTSGAETLIGVSRPSNLGVNALAYTTWDDFSNLMQNFTFPSWIPTTPPVSGANNNLSATIVSGGGTTTLTLSNSAGATVAGVGIRLDAGPAFVAAAAAASATGVLYIPGGTAAGQDVTNFVINNYCDLTPYKLSVVQNGNVTVRETLALGGAGLRYTGNTLSSGGTLSQNTWGSFPHFNVFEAVPGMYINNGNSNTVRGIQFQFGVTGSPIQNGVLLVLSEPGFNGSWEDDAFTTGSLSTDLVGYGLILRGQPSAGVSDTTMTRITLVTGLNSDGASHNSAFFCNNCGTLTISTMYNIRTGIIFYGSSSGETLSLQYTHYNGGFTPLVSAIAPNTVITLGGSGTRISMDTIGHPCVAVFTGSPAVYNNGCGPSGYTFKSPSVTGTAVLVNNGSIDNNTLTTSLQTEPSVANSLIFNTTGPHGGISVGYNDDAIFVQGAPVAAPTCSVSAGGSVATGSYQFAVTPNWWAAQVGQYGTNSTLSNVCTTTTGNQTITINWTAASGNPQSMHLFVIGVPNNGVISGGSTPCIAGICNNADFPPSTTSVVWSSGGIQAPVALNFPHSGPTELLPASQGITSGGPIQTQTLKLSNTSVNSFTSSINASSLTANRIITPPDGSGTMLLSNTQFSAYDNFNRANGGLGSNWTTATGTTAPTITSNAVLANGGSSQYAYWTANIFLNDQFSQFTPAVASANRNDLTVRASGGNAYVCSWNGAASSGIYRQTGGTSFSALATAGPGTYNAGDVLRFEVQGTTLNCFKNGVLIYTTTDSTFPSGSPGIGLTGATAIIDNWSGGNLHPVAQLDTEQDWTQPQHFTQPVTIGTPAPVSGTLAQGNVGTAVVNIASGTVTLGSASIAAISGTTVTCSANANVAATGVLTTDTIIVAPNTAESSPNTGLILRYWPTANQVNFIWCNPTASALTPGVETINWRVVR